MPQNFPYRSFSKPWAKHFLLSIAAVAQVFQMATQWNLTVRDLWSLPSSLIPTLFRFTRFTQIA